jgi:tetratricopeptide (TPR) repeat protein
MDKMHTMRRQGIISVTLWLVVACASVPLACAEDAVTSVPLVSLDAEVSSHPDDYQAWFRLGVAYAGQRHFQQAIEAFRQVIALRPDLAEPHNNLAVIYNEVGDEDAAVHELQIALQKQPGYVKAEENLADLYLKLAIEHYRHVLDQAPDPMLSARYERLLHVRDPLAAPAPSRPVPAAAALPVPVPVAMKAPAASTRLPAMAAASVSAKAPTAISDKPAVGRPGVPSSDRADVIKAFEGWRAAWSARDLDGYFAAYSNDFTPNAHMDHAAWKRYKRRVIMAKDFIHVGAKDVVFESLQAGKRAQLTFDEHFESSDYREDTRKRLDFVKIDGMWKITHEADL